MDSVSAGFWGGYFSIALLMLMSIAYVLARGVRRVAVNASVSLGVATLFVITCLGWLPIDSPDIQARVQAHVAILTAMLLAYMLLDLFGYLRRGQRVRLVILGLSLVALLVLWLLPARTALLLSVAVAAALALFALTFSVRGAAYSERMTLAASGAAFSMLIALIGLARIALAVGPLHWSVHAISAVATSVYLLLVSWALWDRYAYLSEVRQVLACGPAFDPVTRLPSHTETSHLVEAAFFRHDGERMKVGVLAITVGNLFALEQLHGLQAFNHALFVCASRLQRSSMRQATLGRLGDDGFLLVMRHMEDPVRLIRMARRVAARLTKPVVLSTRQDEGKIEDGQTQWVAEVGVGVLAVADGKISAANAVKRARAMAATALAYPSRVAWFNPDTGQIDELPYIEIELNKGH